MGVLAGTTRFDLRLGGSSWVLRRAAAGMTVTKGCWKGQMDFTDLHEEERRRTVSAKADDGGGRQRRGHLSQTEPQDGLGAQPCSCGCIYASCKLQTTLPETSPDNQGIPRNLTSLA